MPIAETLQPEAGDDRNKDVLIEKLNEIYYGPDAVEPSGLGDIVLSHKRAGIPTSRFILRRAHVELRLDHN